MGFVFRKRDAIFVVTMLIIVVVVFALGIIVGVNSSLFNRDSTSADDHTISQHSNISVDDEEKSSNVDGDDVYNSVPIDLSPQIVEIIEQKDNCIKIDTSLGDKWVDMNSIRQTVLLDVPSYNQMTLGYPLGCEVVSLAMMMNYEHDVSVHDIAAELPRADHPDEGFRGDPASSTRGWTIFPPALSGLMHKYLGNAYDMSNLEIQDLREQLNKNIPILVWVSGLGWPVHALCLTGYDENGFYYNDPATGAKDMPISYDDFYAIWNKPIYDRVLDITYDPRKALSYFS